MEKILPPNETVHDDLVGVVSIKLEDVKDFNSLCCSLAGYDPVEYDAVALRVYIENKPIVTVYARNIKEPKESATGKLYVHKFKTELSLDDLFYKLRQVNFTVVTGEYSIENMEVIN